MTRSVFHGLIRREPELGIKAIELLSERLSFYEQRIADLALKKLPARLASVILQLVEQDGVITGDEDNRILTRYTHEDLASMIGAKRVAVTRAMKVLREIGAVGHVGRHIVVEDTAALQRIAQDAA
jgi:CRP/FNR family transcriptional regulator, cyclic AMP receptor protein